uniref:Gamma-tubulin complex component n=1 Tax=Hirondellea gigas TaxID=1518452 RepID=A0A2P2IA15_9CRUS
MMQELLLALLGYDGPIFQLKAEQRFEVCDGIFTERERVMLERVLETATCYSKLMIFCRDNTRGQGRYRAALASALLEATKRYREGVVSLESELLANPQLTPTHLHTTLHLYTPALVTLRDMIDEVSQLGVRGCRLLGVLHRHTEQAVLDNRTLMNSVEQSVHAVLYDQLLQWLLYGALMDPYSEFFLRNKQSPTEAGGESEEQGGKGSAASSVELVTELLPSHLPAVLAHKLLFVGQAVREFDANKHDGSAGRLLEDNEDLFVEQLTALAEAESFSLLRLTQTVDNITATVSKHLCSVVVRGGIVAALDDLKGVMLLGRGELYHTFLEVAAPMLDAPVNTTTNACALFQSSGQLVQVGEDLLERFTVCCSVDAVEHLPAVVKDTYGHANTGWSSLHLEYSTGTVLQQLLCTAGVQRQYNELFSFLLCVKRAQQKLHRCWLRHNISIARAASEERAVWSLRHHMTLLLDGLQYYLQVDVLECEHYRLVSSINSCEDYQQLQGLIASYLSSLSCRCYLRHKLVSKCFSLIFSLCHRFCQFLQEKEDEPATEPESQTSQPSLSELESEFESASSRLFLVLCSLQQLPGQQHTASLLARLDYNYHYRNKQRRTLHAIVGEDE